MNKPPTLFVNIPGLFLLLIAAWGTFIRPVTGRPADPPANHAWGGIRVVDQLTGRGVPLVELESTHSVRWVSDNSGCVFIDDESLLDRTVFFYVHGHGYDVDKDAFGYEGVQVHLSRGKISEVQVKRKVVAQRMARLTGKEQLRDTKLLGVPTDRYLIPLNGEVVGQDSIQSIPWKGKVLCLWGDTSLANHPLGLFRAAGAYAPLMDAQGQTFDPSFGVPYRYFVDSTSHIVRPMMPLLERPGGVVWLDGLAKVKDSQGMDNLIAHYSRRSSLVDELEQGLAILDEESMEFKVLKTYATNEEHRHPYGHAQCVNIAGKEWLVFGNPFPNLRVPATLESIQNPEDYEVLTPIDDAGEALVQWDWRKNQNLHSSMQEAEEWQKNASREDGLHFLPINTHKKTERIIFHNGSFAWNAYRKKWIILGGRWMGSDSLLGEVWFTESDKLEGPYRQAIQVATHKAQTFYNVRHHAYWDREEGRVIFFEGTFTADFSGNPYKTPRYNYNQILYRLNLEDISSEF